MSQNKFRTKHILLIVFLIILFIILSLTLTSTGYSGNTIVYPSIYTTQTIQDVSKLKQLVIEKYEYIKSKSNFLSPYNITYFDFMLNNLKQAENITYENLVGYSMLAPNSTIGFGDIVPLKNKLITLPFQYEAGDSGWYWIYYTDRTTKSSVLVNILRYDLIPPDIRKRNKLNFGESTLYNISIGCGDKNGYTYIPYTIVTGKFTKNKTGVKFSNSNTTPSINIINLECTNNGTISFDFKGKDIMNDDLEISLRLKTNHNPYFNSPNGCYPFCFEGLGSNYWSYTDLGLTTSSTILMNQNGKPVTINLTRDGNGWMDRQWFKGNVPKSIFTKILLTLWPRDMIGIGSYIWITIQLENIQYLIIAYDIETGVNSLDSKIKPNNVIMAEYNVYSAAGSGGEYSKSCKIRISSVFSIPGLANIYYPETIIVYLEEDTYKISCKDMGYGYTIDLTNNIRQTSGSLVYSGDGKLIGSGLIEANNLQPSNILKSNQYKLLNLKPGSTIPDRSILIQQKIPAIIILAIYILLIISVIILICFIIQQETREINKLHIGYDFI